MPKQKTKSAAKKRLTLKKSGLVKRNKQNRRHILTKKSPNRKRKLRKSAYVSTEETKTARKLLNA